jgi:hypothetical protein
MGNTQEFVESLEGATGTLAYTHPMSDRRVASRHKQMFVTQMTPWVPGHPSIPFEVILADVSEGGAGVIHEQACAAGMRYLLNVPRGEGERPIVREYGVVHCRSRADGRYDIGLELIVRGPLDEAEEGGAGVLPPPPPTCRHITSHRLKLLFLAFGLACLLYAFFVPL